MNIQKIPTCGLQIDLSQNKTSQSERVDKKLDAISCRDLRWTSTDFFFESSEVSTGIRLAPRWSQCVNHRLRPVEARGSCGRGRVASWV